MSIETTSLPVEYLFTLKVPNRAQTLVNSGPHGTRVVVDAPVGTFEGPRLRGTLRGPGGDWVTVRANGALKLDVRILLETDDGAIIFMTYNGIATSGGAWIRSAPIFETGDERYAWLNDVQAVGVGANEPPVVRYDIYRVL